MPAHEWRDIIAQHASTGAVPPEALQRNINSLDVRIKRYEEELQRMCALRAALPYDVRYPGMMRDKNSPVRFRAAGFGHYVYTADFEDAANAFGQMYARKLYQNRGVMLGCVLGAYHDGTRMCSVTVARRVYGRVRDEVTHRFMIEKVVNA